MHLKKFLLGIVIVLAVVLIGLQAFHQYDLAEGVQIPIVTFLTVYYVLHTKDKVSYFFKFLVAFSIAEFLGVLNYVYLYVSSTTIVDFLQYYIRNIFYLVAFCFLILEILKGIKIKEVIKQMPIHLFILLAVSVYCVYLASKMAIESEYFYSVYEQPYMLIEDIFEIVYNSVIMILLSVSLVNYLRRGCNKSMSLLFGTLCIVFSELIQASYYFIDEEIEILNLVFSVLMVIAFVLYFVQIPMEYSKEIELSDLDEFEVN